MDASQVTTVLVMALTLAAQPWSILGGIILVTTRHGIIKEVAYVLGWVAALSTVMALTLTLKPDSDQVQSTTSAAAWASIVIGLALTFWLLVRFRRPAPPKKSQSPAWMAKLDSMPWYLAAVLGAFLPNYLVVVPAGTALLDAGLTGAALVAWAIAFVLIASIGVAAPLGVLLVRRDKAPQTYAAWHKWIIGNSRMVSYGTGMLIGLMITAQGIANLVT